jgi:hypothetical protein
MFAFSLFVSPECNLFHSDRLHHAETEPSLGLTLHGFAHYVSTHQNSESVLDIV